MDVTSASTKLKAARQARDRRSLKELSGGKREITACIARPTLSKRDWMHREWSIYTEGESYVPTDTLETRVQDFLTLHAFTRPGLLDRSMTVDTMLHYVGVLSQVIGRSDEVMDMDMCKRLKMVGSLSMFSPSNIASNCQLVDQKWPERDRRTINCTAGQEIGNCSRSYGDNELFLEERHPFAAYRMLSCPAWCHDVLDELFGMPTGRCRCFWVLSGLKRSHGMECMIHPSHTDILLLWQNLGHQIYSSATAKRRPKSSTTDHYNDKVLFDEGQAW